MNSIQTLILALLVFTFSGLAQTKSYWKNAPTAGTKIYSIEFIDSDNGLAKARTGEVLITTDGGRHWTMDDSGQKSTGHKRNRWSADIYCSVMNTTDGGVTWQPYIKEMQTHFCKVYFRDENTGWAAAEEFLQEVTRSINSFINKNDLQGLNNISSQCTEYYTDMNKGWALGWCVKNYISD